MEKISSTFTLPLGRRREVNKTNTSQTQIPYEIHDILSHRERDLMKGKSRRKHEGYRQYTHHFGLMIERRHAQKNLILDDALVQPSLLLLPNSFALCNFKFAHALHHHIEFTRARLHILDRPRI